jgi:hypothetical protein
MIKGDSVDQANFKSTAGIMFFGVPSQGMDVKALMAIVREQANEDLLSSLRRESKLLLEIHEKFCSTFIFKDSRIIHFYETKESPTVVKVSYPNDES